MHGIGQRDRDYGRRLAACAGAAVALHLALVLLPFPGRRTFEPAAERPASGPGILLVEVESPSGQPAGAGAASVELPAGARSRPAAEPAVVPEVAPEALAARHEISPVPAPAKEVAGTLAASGPRPGAADTVAAGGTGGTGGGEPGAGGSGREPVEMVLVRNVIVHPRIPARVMARKIDDFVRLQILVGIDGRVLRVRVAHSIPDCEECNESAVEAARQERWDPPLIYGRPGEAWTSLEIRFSYRR